MPITFDEFKRRADALRADLAEACATAGRHPGEVTLLPVTKTQPAEAAEFAARCGFESVGENRVQEAVEKKALCRAALRWELIGHLQSNKAAEAAQHFARVQSVDSGKLARRLGAAATAIGRRLPILLQVNAGQDPAKFGADVAGAGALLDAALAEPGLLVEGLMTIAPLAEDPAVAERCFAALRETRDRLARSHGVALRELSMGMSGDFRAAIAAGSTLIRIGTALYGAR